MYVGQLLSLGAFVEKKSREFFSKKNLEAIARFWPVD